MVYQVKGIKPKKMNIKEVRQELLNELRKEGKEVEKLYAQTVASWKGEKPDFESLIGLERGDGSASVLTGPVGSSEGVNKFKWLDEGTSKRYALMSSDWKSKTTPGKLQSGSGRGKVLAVGKRRVPRPRPGIKARGWTIQIQNQRKKPFIKNMIGAKNRGMAKLYD